MDRSIPWRQNAERVNVNGSFSTDGSVISGIPEGSVLGPPLFLIFINDLPANLFCPALLFADETKVYSHVRDKADAQTLQNDLTKLEQWSEMWLLKFHPE